MRPAETSARPSARWRVFARRLTMPTVASIVITALCLGACSTSKKAQSASQAVETRQKVERTVMDSTREVTVVRQQAVTVPESKVTVTIVKDSLLRLPEGASWTGRSGQANVNVQRRAATDGKPEVIVVEATCDSLQLQCERYEQTIATQQRAIDALADAGYRLYAEQREEEKEKPPNGIETALKWLFTGIIIGLLLGRIKAIIKFVKRIKQ